MLKNWLSPGGAKTTASTLLSTLCHRSSLGYCWRPGFTASLTPHCFQYLHQRCYRSTAQKLKPTNHYTTLDITPTASEDEIKEAYYKLCKLYHPDADHSMQNEEKFNAISEAYNVLKDSASRRRYDVEYRNTAGSDITGFVVSRKPFTGSTVEYQSRVADNENYKKWEEEMRERQSGMSRWREGLSRRSKVSEQHGSVEDNDLHLDGRHAWVGVVVVVLSFVSVVVYTSWKFVRSRGLRKRLRDDQRLE